MAFGINKKSILFILNPYSFYKHLKKKRLLKKYADVKLRLGDGVSINKSQIEQHVYLGNEVSLQNSSIGSHSYVNSKTNINFTEIGKFCSIGPNVKFGMGLHPTNLISTHPSFYSNNKSFKTFADKTYFKEYDKTILGNDVWVGSDVIVMGGISIADGAIIAAGAVVTKDVGAYEVVGGIPAKHIKYRINKELIEKIRNTKWWDKDEKWFEEHYHIFLDDKKFRDYFNIT